MVIFINQIRMKDWSNVLVVLKTTTGGNALKFYASIRLDIRRIGAIKDGDEVIGNQNPGEGSQKIKMAPPFKTG